MAREIAGAILPRLGLRRTLRNWTTIARGLCEAPRQRQLQSLCLTLIGRSPPPAATLRRPGERKLERGVVVEIDRAPVVEVQVPALRPSGGYTAHGAVCAKYNNRMPPRSGFRSPFAPPWDFRAGTGVPGSDRSGGHAGASPFGGRERSQPQ